MSTEPARILVVDDYAATRCVIAGWLRRDGYLVSEAATGAEALTRVRTEPVDIVVLDVSLPDADGFEVCELIKKSPATAALPVIHVSAVYVDVVDRTHGLTRGADAYLVEPVDPDELRATVYAVLRHYRARRHAERKAERLMQLVETTSVVNAAESFVSCLQAAACGTARIFDGSAVVTAVSPDGHVMTAETRSPPGPTVIDHCLDGSFDGPVDNAADPGAIDTKVRREPNSRWPTLAGAAPAAPVWSVTVGVKNAQTPMRIAVCAAGFVDDDATVLRQWGHAVAHALEAVRARAEPRRAANALQSRPGPQPALSTSPSRVGWAPLTRREREIAMLIAEGHTNRKIAALLMIAKRTVDAHIEHILAKLGFCSRAQIAAWVVEHSPAGIDPAGIDPGPQPMTGRDT